jgi:PAS domain S-box-containing protein
MIAFRDRPSLPVLLLLGNTLVAANLAAGFVSWRFQRTRRLHFLAEKELADLVVQLRESRERLQSVLDVSTDGYWERDLVTGMVLHSGRMNEITGRPALDTVVGTDDWRGRMHPDDLREIGPAYDAAMASREGHFDRVFRTRHADGTWRWVRSRGGVSARDPSGKPLRIAGTISDVQAQKEAEDALQRSEALQRAVMENFPNGLVGLFDRDLRYVLIDGTNTITATSPRDWKGRTLQELTPAEVLPMIEPAYRAALQGESRRVQLPLGGHVIDVLLEPVRDGSGAVTHGLFMTQDVTEKRALEERLVVASRLASLGTLVAGVAHEINNPLTGELAGQGFAIEEIERVKEAIGPGGPVDRDTIVRRLDEALDALRDAQAGGQRIARVVKDLSTFGRPDPQRSRVRLMDVVDEAMRFLPATVSGAAAIRVENLGVPEVLASAGQIGQVLVNLVSNGSRAMAGKEKGTVRITVGPGSPGMALIEVADDGRGMPPEVLARIFDPFFTTRKAGEGMGLGLPICHSIVTAHGGTISARSEPGKGSVFRVELPAAADQA